MGSATAVALALRHPERVSALAVVTPAHLGRPSRDLDRWDALADGLLRGGSGGLPRRARAPDGGRALARDGALGDPPAPGAARATPPRWPTRCAASPARPPSTGWTRSRRLAVPTLIVGSRDEVDPDHPLAVAEEYADRIPGARLVVEDEGESPLAWRGGALSREVLALLTEG